MELALLFGGVVVSLIVEMIKTKLGGSTSATMAVVVILSLLGGVIYTALTYFQLWEAFLGIIISAGAFYAFIIKNIKA